MKMLFLIPFFLIPFRIFAQNTNVQDTIHWSKERKLTWKDFKGKPDTSSEGGAATVSGFVTYSSYTSDTTISVVLKAVFYKKRSWTKEQFEDAASLDHEQGHFNITEVFARKANTAYSKYKLNKTTVTEDVHRIFNSFVQEKDRVQDLYDKETSNHRNTKKQKEWNKKIAGWLRTPSE